MKKGLGLRQFYVTLAVLGLVLLITAAILFAQDVEFLSGVVASIAVELCFLGVTGEMSLVSYEADKAQQEKHSQALQTEIGELKQQVQQASEQIGQLAQIVERQTSQKSLWARLWDWINITLSG
jgi:hypothetical protein